MLRPRLARAFALPVQLACDLPMQDPISPEPPEATVAMSAMSSAVLLRSRPGFYHRPSTGNGVGISRPLWLCRRHPIAAPAERLT
jgi:hypothetical protein